MLDSPREVGGCEVMLAKVSAEEARGGRHGARLKRATVVTSSPNTISMSILPAVDALPTPLAVHPHAALERAEDCRPEHGRGEAARDDGGDGNGPHGSHYHPSLTSRRIVRRV
jgi:hypothetical protein